MNVDELAKRTSGPVLAEGDEGWDDARLAFNLLIDQRPAGIVLPERVEDVVAAIGFASVNDLRIAAQRTGHNAGPLGDLSDTLLVRTDRLGGATVEPNHRHAAVGPAARWGDVTGPASEVGLAPLAGSSPNVGVVGYTLGGGLSWLGRKHGLACNSVRAVQLVNARGEIVHADAESEPDLFWALRGGGGGLGVVTGIEFDLYEVPQLYAGMLAWPWERAGEVLEAWRGWTGDAPEEAMSVGRIVQIPPFEEIPELVRGKKLAIVEVAFLGGEDEGAELIAPLRELGPDIDTFAAVRPRHSASCTWIRRSRYRGPPTTRCSATCRRRRSPRWSTRRGRTPTRRSCRWSCVTSAARSRARPPMPACSRRSTAPFPSSRSAWSRTRRWAKRSARPWSGSARHTPRGRRAPSSATSASAPWRTRRSSDARRSSACAR